jgi:tocopherol cyclase
MIPSKLKIIGTLFIHFLILNATLCQSQSITKFYKIGDSKPGYGLKKAKHAKLFQGNKKDKNYFEGWYFKMISQNETSAISIIPGISFSKNGDEKHAFIQIINGQNGQTFYKSFKIDSFQFSLDKFAVKIAGNYFSQDSIVINIQDDSLQIEGTIFMQNLTDLTPFKRKNKRIMGIFRFTPFMQCYHGVVSVNHDLKGKLMINEQAHVFDSGKGYIEKDWGSSMPVAWIWMQSNNFTTENTSFMLSIANIPWLGSHFTGFLGFFLHDNKVHRFGTYNRSKLEFDIVSQNQVNISIKHKRHTYLIEAKQETSGILLAPVNGSMDRRISEGINAKLKIKAFNNKDQLIFSDSTSIAGLELVGDINILK